MHICHARRTSHARKKKKCTSHTKSDLSRLSIEAFFFSDNQFLTDEVGLCREEERKRRRFSE